MPIIVLSTVLLVIFLIICYLFISLGFQFDIILGNHITENTKATQKQYTTKYQEIMKEAYELTVQRSKQRKMKHKGWWDRVTCLEKLQSTLVTTM